MPALRREGRLRSVRSRRPHRKRLVWVTVFGLLVLIGSSAALAQGVLGGKFRTGDQIVLHPLHLHGYHFTVVARDGSPARKPYQADTLVVAPGETYEVLVPATEPGVWALHCHILSHVEGPEGMFGMATALVVE